MRTQSATSSDLSDLPRTVPGWLAAVAEGMAATELGDRLLACRAAAAASQDLGLWIHLCPAPQFEAQLGLLRQRLEESVARRELLQTYPLLGVPFAVKDNIHIGGEPTTAACPAFAQVARTSATVVQKLLDAGAVWIGKTNLDQFATGLVGTRSPYGHPACVADSSRVSGGSSSGSAVAVARGLVAFALGTDTAGSGRVPAGFNGLVGLKPTPGRVSNTGVLPACRTLDCVAVLAHTVADASHVLAVIEGADALDPYSHFVPGPAFVGASSAATANGLPRPLRLGVPSAPVLDAEIGYDQAWQHALSHARQLGHELVELDFGPLNEVAALLYEGPWVAERHAVVAQLMLEQPQALEPTVLAVIAKARQFSATQTFEAMYRLKAAQQAMRAIWSQVDALLVPTAPTHPSFAQVRADPVGSNAQLGLYTNFVNLLGWCALAVPAGSTPNGLPFGVTFIGPGGHDVVLAGLGRDWTWDPAAQPATVWPDGLPCRPATTATLTLAVVGAHLSGLPLNWQLQERGAQRLELTRTAPLYRLYALPGTSPPKPGLLRVGDDGGSVTVELWAVPLTELGSFLALIPAPLGLGTLQLEDGRQVHGFLCESHAVTGAADITAWGGWRAYLGRLSTPISTSSTT